VPGIKDCAVFGIPDKDFGETLAAQIEVGADGSLDAVVALIMGIPV
jgi:long-chain acyl-CoA synthetase